MNLSIARIISGLNRSGHEQRFRRWSISAVETRMSGDRSAVARRHTNHVLDPFGRLTLSNLKLICCVQHAKRPHGITMQSAIEIANRFVSKRARAIIWGILPPFSQLSHSRPALQCDNAVFSNCFMNHFS